MAKGYQAHKERQMVIDSFGKVISRRAEFRCEWCEGKGELRLWDSRPGEEVAPEYLALLCGDCRELAAGGMSSSDKLHSIRNALWSDIPAVAVGAANVLARSKEVWAREAIEESLIDEDIKNDLLKKR